MAFKSIKRLEKRTKGMFNSIELWSGVFDGKIKFFISTRSQEKGVKGMPLSGDILEVRNKKEGLKNFELNAKRLGFRLGFKKKLKRVM